MNHRVIVLGAGNVGRLIARELLLMGHEVCVADISEENLQTCADFGCDTMQIDVTDPDTGIFPICALYSLTVNCMPGFASRAVQEGLVAAGAPLVVDTTFGPEDPFELHSGCLRGRGTVFVPDVGIAPGLSNLLVSQLRAYSENIVRGEIYVGGLPTARFEPFQYEASFNLPDLMEEYTRPARVIQGPRIAELPPMSDIRKLDVKDIGTLEGFISDGLRTLAKTKLGIFSELGEYTLRYPGHCDAVRKIMAKGLFDEEHMKRAWRKTGSPTFTYLEVRGISKDFREAAIYSLLVRDSEVADSMAVATGTVAAAVADVLLGMEMERRAQYLGCQPLELFDRPERERILSRLEERGLKVQGP